MDPMQAILFGVVIPGAIALALVAALRGAPGVGLAAGYGAAFALLLGWPGLLPVDVTQVSPWVAVVAAGIAILNKGRAVATGALGLALGVFLARPLFADAPGLLLLVAAAVALSVVVFERGLDRELGKAEARGGALGTTILISGASLTVLFSDIASLAQVTGALAAATGAVFALGLIWPKRADLQRASPVIAGIVMTNLWSATLYANGRWEVLALIALAPLLSSLFKRPAKTLAAIAAPAAILAVPVALAAVLAGSQYLRDPEPEAAAQPSATSETTATSPSTTTPSAPAYDPDYGY